MARISALKAKRPTPSSKSPGRELTDDEIAYIKKWAGKTSYNKIAAKLRIGTVTLFKAASRLKINIPQCSKIGGIELPEFAGESSLGVKREKKSEVPISSGVSKSARTDWNDHRKQLINHAEQFENPIVSVDIQSGKVIVYRYTGRNVVNVKENTKTAHRT